jgi:cytochrome c oxidase cbb3-type subunit 3
MSDPSSTGADPHETALGTSSGHDQLLDHEYDGIREYDNPMPRWWVWIFAGTFWFSLGYLFHYHVSGNGVSVAAAYEADVAQAREQAAKANLSQPVSEESLGKLLGDAALMKDAHALFTLRCSPCHGDKAQGTIGPNLTDDAWIHGRGTLTDIFNVVDQGVLAKGMPAWGKQLSPIEVRKLAAFVGSQRGKNVAGKPPEGVVVEHP